MNRQIILKHILDNPGKVWDMIVIGGGATGLGIALDSATRGYSTLLLEQSDFAKATSSRSTKLVHGGVRYMAQGDLLLVREALHERGILMKNAPHLTFNQEFIIPVYSNFDVLKYTLGLKFYDMLAGSLSMGKSYFIDSRETLKRMPLLRKKGLKGAVVYHDGQFDDSRLAVALAMQTVSNGGSVLNYMSAAGFMKNSEGRITGVKAIDQLSGAAFQFNSRVVINATGVFADAITRMDNKDALPSLKPSQGVHVVLDKSFLQSDSAIMIPKTTDGRVLFAIPWYDEIVVGTTDTPIDDIALEPIALEREIDFILKTAGDYLEKKPVRSDALCIFAGLRPLAADPENPGATKEVSRRHKITVSSSGLISIVGGKWTTYRKMAQETIDKASKMGWLDPRKCVTKDYNLTNGAGVVAGRLGVYGKGGNEILRIIKEDPELGAPLDRNLPYTAAEIIWICRNEMPIRLEDILARRTRALFLDARASLRIAPQVAEIMMKESGFTCQWRDEQLESYTSLVSRYI